MYKIALAGKAGTGKNTAAEIICSIMSDFNYWKKETVSLAFADPIKEIVKEMFPHVKRNHLYGASKFRDEIISGAYDSDGNPLTIRRALLDIGTKVGRSYNDSVWLEVMEFKIQKAVKKNKQLVIITDVRFRNEFDWLKKQGFFMIKVERDTQTKINHVSETGQNQILDSEFSFILNNNGSKKDLENIIQQDIISIL